MVRRSTLRAVLTLTVYVNVSSHFGGDQLSIGREEGVQRIREIFGNVPNIEPWGAPEGWWMAMTDRNQLEYGMFGHSGSF